jgi:hypothetical protein
MKCQRNGEIMLMYSLYEDTKTFEKNSLFDAFHNNNTNNKYIYFFYIYIISIRIK